MNVYVVTMYRWGDREKHSYVLGVYSLKAVAIAEAQKEQDYRGGNKYYPEILLVPVDAVRLGSSFKEILPLEERKFTTPKDRLEVGMKVVPHKKSVLRTLEHSVVWQAAQEKNQFYLYFTGIHTDVIGYDGIAYMLDHNPLDVTHPTGDFFAREDFTIYGGDE